jgi:peptidoglycan/xylan/chitin deacetylase (PgdA/CDA1 family)
LTARIGVSVGASGEVMVKAGPAQVPALVISLDFELMWGMRDRFSVEEYSANLLGVRDAIPRILDLFERSSIRATWATVGFLFCETKDEIIASMPSVLPTYDSARLSNYRYIEEIGTSERDDPYFFGLGLLQQVMSCPGQEIGTHTFSHYYCLEVGQTEAQFAADIDAALTLAQRRGVTLKSIVFPRNQYGPAHLEVVRSKGLRVFRGNERSWLYKPTGGSEQTLLRRGGRLADHYLNLSGDHVSEPTDLAGLTDIAASRFLRPYSPILHRLDGLRLRRIQRSMTAAAQTNSLYHLWWHPHNFGLNTRENLMLLKKIIEYFHVLRDSCNMRSSSMGDFAV